MKHLMVDLATLPVSSCSIYVSLVFLGVYGSSDMLLLISYVILICMVLCML